MADDKPQPIPRKTPKKRSGPSMRDQIAARRRAELAGQTPDSASKPAPKPASKAGAGKSKPAAAPRPARKVAAPKAASTPKPTFTPKAASTPKAAAKAPAEKGERPARPTVARKGSRRAGAGRTAKADDGGEDSGEGRRSRRERPEPKKKSALPLIAAAVVAVGGVGGYLAMSSGGEAQASETEGGESTETAAGETQEGGADPNAGAAAGAEGSAEGADAAEGDAEGGDAAAEGTPEGDAAPMADKPADKPKKKGLVGKTTEELAAMVSALEPLAKPAEVSDEKWAEMNADADLVFDGGGAASGRAEKRLGEDGNKYAWPLMINRMAKIDYTDEDQVQSGMAGVRVMQMSRGSTNMGGMGWMTAAETKDGEFNDKAHRKDMMIVIKAHESWTSVINDPEWWQNKLYKGDMYKEAEALKKDSLEKELEGLDDLDDLDLDDLNLDDDGE